MTPAAGGSRLDYDSRGGSRRATTSPPPASPARYIRSYWLPSGCPPWLRVYAFVALWRGTGLAAELHDRLRESVRWAEGRHQEPSAGHTTAGASSSASASRYCSKPITRYLSTSSASVKAAPSTASTRPTKSRPATGQSSRDSAISYLISKSHT